MMSSISTKRKENHIGERTQTQDQFITPVSFKTINTIVKNPGNPIPPLDMLLLFLLIFSS